METVGNSIMTMRDIFFLGDSITYGEWDEQGGWVQRLRAPLDQAYVQGKGVKSRVYNLGITGNTSQDLLRRLDTEVGARFNKAAETFIVIAIGMNDTHMMMPENTPFSTPEEFGRNLGLLIGAARKFTRKIALVGLNPIEQQKTDPLPWNTAKAYRTDRVRVFNTIIEKMAAEEELFFVDIWKDWALLDHKTLLCDGLHPNGDGHRRIASRVAAFFKCDSALE